MKRRSWMIPIMAALVLCGQPSVVARAATLSIRIGGTGGALGAMSLLGEGYEKVHPDVDVVVLPSLGSSGAIKALLAGQLDLAVTSRPLEPEEQKSGLKSIPFARTPFVFAVSTKSAVTQITTNELAAIYSGERKTWPDGTPVRPVLRPKGDSDTRLVESMSPELQTAVESALSRNGMILAVTDQDSANSIETVPGAIGTTTLALILSEKRAMQPLTLDGKSPSVGAIANGKYSCFKTWHLVIRDAPREPVRQFVSFVGSTAGREILTRTGHEVLGEAWTGP